MIGPRFDENDGSFFVEVWKSGDYVRIGIQASGNSERLRWLRCAYAYAIDRSRRPVRYANELPPQVESLVAAAAAEHASILFCDILGYVAIRRQALSAFSY